MKIRSAFVLVIALGALVPLSARASHCDVPIYLFSYTNVNTGQPDPTTDDPDDTLQAPLPSLTSSAIGCTIVRDSVLAGEPDPSAHAATETDWIYPGSNELQVRWIASNDPSAIASATLNFAGVNYNLDLQKTTDITGADATFLDSQVIEVDPTTTVAGNDATVTVCTTEGECFTRVYSTIA
jgi:hypothetical protein